MQDELSGQGYHWAGLRDGTVSLRLTWSWHTCAVRVLIPREVSSAEKLLIYLSARFCCFCGQIRWKNVSSSKTRLFQMLDHPVAKIACKCLPRTYLEPAFETCFGHFFQCLLRVLLDSSSELTSFAFLPLISSPRQVWRCLEAVVSFFECLSLHGPPSNSRLAVILDASFLFGIFMLCTTMLFFLHPLVLRKFFENRTRQ